MLELKRKELPVSCAFYVYAIEFLQTTRAVLLPASLLHTPMKQKRRLKTQFMMLMQVAECKFQVPEFHDGGRQTQDANKHATLRAYECHKNYLPSSRLLSAF